MASTYVNNLRLNEMGTGDQSGTWGTVTNTNLELIGDALGYGTQTLSNASTATSNVSDGSSAEARAMYLKYSGTLSATCTITITPNTMKRVQIIENATSGGQSIIIKQGSGATVTIPNGTSKVCVLDGAGAGAAVIDGLQNLAISGDLTVGGDDLKMATNTSGHVLVGDGTNYNPVAMSGDATIAANGAITIANDAVGADELASNAVVDASVASNAAIDASKIANGTVSNTEFQYLNGVTSSIQTQLTSALNAGNFPEDTWITSGGSEQRLKFLAPSTTTSFASISNSWAGSNIYKSGSTYGGHLFYDGTDSEIMYMTHTGSIAAKANVTAYYSDERLKEKTGDIENAIEKVKQIDTFYYKENELAKSFGFDNDRQQIGVSAQSVEKVVPEIISLAPFDWDVNNNNLSKSGEDYMTVDYSRLVPLLIEAVKDLSKQLEELKNGTTD